MSRARAAILALGLCLAGCGTPCTPSGPDFDLESCRRACDEGSPQACAGVGLAYHGGRMGDAPDLTTAGRFYERACEEAATSQRRALCLSNEPLEQPLSDAAAERASRRCLEGILLGCNDLVRSLHTPISVPAPPAIEREPPGATATLTIAADGALELDGDPTTLEALSRRAPIEGESFVISAARSTSHGRLIEVIDALRAAGVTRYAVNVAGAP